MSNSANINALTNLVNNIQDALSTAETGSALVERPWLGMGILLGTCLSGLLIGLGLGWLVTR